MNLTQRTATELVRLIADKSVSARELTSAFIDRIESQSSRINAVVAHDFERALEAAQRADTELAQGRIIGPLHGLAVTVKESLDVEGLATTWGVSSAKTQIATADAVVVERLRAAGAIILGKTNVPVMLGDYQTDNPVYGRTNNPWDTARSPGGSSGGSAAAVAMGMTGIGIGSDLGGSIRVPCHLTGVFGHKPTWGVMPMRGQAPPGAPRLAVDPDLAVIGPIARSAEDLLLSLDVAAGPDRLQTGWQLSLPPPRARSARALRIAVWATDTIAPVAQDISARVQEVAQALATAGAVVSFDARPAIDPAEARRTFVGLSQGLIGAGIPKAEYERIEREVETLSGDDRSHSSVAQRALVARHRDWVEHDRTRHRLRDAWLTFFEDWDVLLCPVMACTAQTHDHRPPPNRTVDVDGHAQPIFQQVFWSTLATVSLLPATVVPVGLDTNGLPIGVQIIGPAYGDRTTIETARIIATEYGGFQPPPLEAVAHTGQP